MRQLENPGESADIASRVLETVTKKYLVLTFPTPAGQYTTDAKTRIIILNRKTNILHGIHRTRKAKRRQSKRLHKGSNDRETQSE